MYLPQVEVESIFDGAFNAAWGEVSEVGLTEKELADLHLGRAKK